MNFFLVDYENVNTGGLNGISDLSEKDRVVIFYSDKAETITFDLHRKLNESKAEIDFQKVSAGSKNALDFQLCTYLGYLIGQNSEATDDYSDCPYDGGYDGYRKSRETPAAYYIVSGDKDYATVSDYWNPKNVSVSLIPSISRLSALAEEAARKSAENLKAQLKNVLPEKYKAHIPLIADIIRRCQTKQSVNAELVRAFHEGADNSAPSEIYRCVKPLLSDKA